MPSEIVLLSPAELVGRFEDALRAGAAEATVTPVATLEALSTPCADRGGRFRLVAFATDVIVPAPLLTAPAGEVLMLLEKWVGVHSC